MQDNSDRRSNADRTAATRGALIAAARDLFVDKGYTETGTPEIVAAANVTRGALYHHFADKADLFRAVVHAEAQSVAKLIESRSADPTSALDALSSGTDAYFSAMAVPGRVRLLLTDGPAVLGHAEMSKIDNQTGGEELRQGLTYALSGNEYAALPIDALTDLLSAAFDRAVLAIEGGKEADHYRSAILLILKGLIAISKSEHRT
jgi:AcrR family transcriptional regulator